MKCWNIKNTLNDIDLNTHQICIHNSAISTVNEKKKVFFCLVIENCRCSRLERFVS